MMANEEPHAHHPYKQAALEYMKYGWSPLPVGNRPGGPMFLTIEGAT